MYIIISKVIIIIIMIYLTAVVRKPAVIVKHSGKADPVKSITYLAQSLRKMISFRVRIRKTP